MRRPWKLFLSSLTLLFMVSAESSLWWARKKNTKWEENTFFIMLKKNGYQTIIYLIPKRKQNESNDAVTGHNYIFCVCMWRHFIVQRASWVNGGKTSKTKLKDINFNFPMANIMYLSIFCKHVQKEDNTLFGFEEHFYPWYFSTFTLWKIALHSSIVWSECTQHKDKTRGWVRKNNFSRLSKCQMSCFETYFDA